MTGDDDLLVSLSRGLLSAMTQFGYWDLRLGHQLGWALAPPFEGRYRAIPRVARPRCVGRGCGAGFVGAVVRPCFVYVSCSGRLDLLCC